MNTTLQNILDETERGYRGDPWHGPSLLALLSDIDHATANRRISGSHTIAELVAHVTSWKLVVEERLRSAASVDVAPARDYPPTALATASDWQALLQGLEASEQRLVQAIADFDAARLDQTIPGKQHTFAIELRGLAQHDAYHGGQIAILKRASGHPGA